VRRLFYLAFLCLAATTSADIGGRLNIRSEDGNVNTYPYSARFTNGSVTDNNDGTVSVTAGGGSSGASLTSTQTWTGANIYQMNNAPGIKFVGTSGAGISDLTGAAVVIDNTLNQDSNGLQIYTAAPTQGATTGLLDLVAASTSYNEPMIYIHSTATGTIGGNADIRIDSNNPDIEFVETDQISPAGKFEIAVQSDNLQFNFRDAANSSFQNVIALDHLGSMKFKELDNGGDFIAFRATTTMTGSNTFIWPMTSPNAGDALTVSSVGATDQLIWSNPSNFSTLNKQTVAYTITSTDTVVLASCPANTALTFTLPSAAANRGQQLYINKVDVSSQSVTVIANSTDTIASSTGTLTMYAPGQAVGLISDGVSNWISPNGLPKYMPFIGNNQDPSAASATTANNAFYNAVVVPEFVVLTGIRIVVGTASGNVDVGVYDANRKLLAHSGSTTCPASGANTINVAATYLMPGLYYLAIAVDNGTVTMTRSGASAIAGNYSTTTSFPLPSTFTVGVATARNFTTLGIVAGGLSL
jgi:hypothetical protein